MTILNEKENIATNIEFNLAIVRACNEIEKIICDVRASFKEKVKGAEYCLPSVITKVQSERSVAAEKLGNLISKTDFKVVKK